MGGRCIVAGCSNVARDRVICLHNWPKDKKNSRLWKRFITLRRAKWSGPTGRSVVCSAHFTPDQFTNYSKFRMGFVKKLSLKEDAIPTIYSAVNVGTDQDYVSARTAPPIRTAFPKLDHAKEVSLDFLSCGKHVAEQSPNDRIGL